VRRDIQGVVLALLGATVLRLSFTDMMLSYVKPGMRPFLLASGIVLVILGLLSVLVDARESRGAVTEEEASEDHEHGAPRAAWLLVVPVFLVFVVAPPALGAFAAERVPSALPQQGEWTMDPLPPGDPVSLALEDYGYRATWDEGGTLTDRTVELTGFVTPAEEYDGWYLNRLQLSCCAADARVTRVLVTGVEQPSLDSWATVVGTYADPLEAGTDNPVPVVAAESAVEVQAPRNPYE
jgi:uncharacterized repeat protein (TIGR03943 family)